jgi:hypothetical protein
MYRMFSFQNKNGQFGFNMRLCSCSVFGKYIYVVSLLVLCQSYSGTDATVTDIDFVYMWINRCDRIIITGTASLSLGQTGMRELMRVEKREAHFHSRRISRNREFSKNVIVKSWKFSTSKLFSDGKFVSANSRFTKFYFWEKFSWVEMSLLK